MSATQVSDDKEGEKPRLQIQAAESPPVDRHAERKLLLKLDLFILPWVMLLYLLSFLDRVNIGNARLYGLEQDLKLSGNDFQAATAVLFATYVPSELPSNLFLKKARPSRWISFIATSWGIIATLTGVVQSYAGLIVIRLFLGAVEGGLFPGMVVYLTIFYSKRDLATRVLFLQISSAIAGAFGGLLAYGIGFMDGIAGLRAWRWIFIIEGLPTVVVGVAAWFGMADSPQSAWYLTPEERSLLARRISEQTGMTESAQQFHWSDVRAALKDWRMWLFCFGQTGLDTMLYGYSTFLPTIIKGIDPQYKAAIVQLLTVPCYALGAIVYAVIAPLSDLQQRRAMYVVSGCIVCIVGYAILAAKASKGAHYFACFLVAAGLWPSIGLAIAWLPTNFPRYGKRTTATGLQLTIGNTAGIWAPFLYASDTAPRYITGHASTLALVVFSCCIYSLLWWHLARINKKRKSGEQDGRVAGMREAEIAEMGDDSPRFMYTT